MSLYLSKIAIGKKEYLIKDAAAQTKLNTLKAAAEKDVVTIIGETVSNNSLPTSEAVKNYVDAQIGVIHNFDVVIDTDNIVTTNKPTEDNMYKLYLVEDPKASAGEYIEYICIREGNGSNIPYTYHFEKIGSTKTDLTDYVLKTTTIANQPLSSNISVEALSGSNALNLKGLSHLDSAKGKTTETVISSGVAKGSLTGSAAITYDSTATAKINAGTVTPTISVKKAGSAVVASTAVNAVLNEKGQFEIAGSVSAPTVTISSTATSADKLLNPGTLPSKNKDTFTAPSLTAKLKADGNKEMFAKTGLVASIEEGSETLVLSNAETADVMSAITWSSGNFQEGTFNKGTLPTLKSNINVVTEVTKNASVSAPTFTGKKYNLSLANSTVNITDAQYQSSTVPTVTSVTYDKASPTAIVSIEQASLNVENITIPALETSISAK